MGRRIEFTQEETQKIIDLFLDNMPIKTIARNFNVSYKVIDRVLVEQGYKKKKDYNKLTVPRIYFKELTDEQKMLIVENYITKKMSLSKAGAEIGCNQGTVEAVLKEAGVKKRTYAEAKEITRVYTCDDNFFKNQNANMAYILGFIAADGNVSQKENCISIEILKKDKELLEKIKKITQSSRPIKDYIRHDNNKEVSKFAVWSSNWKKDLAIYGIVPNKTFILQPPTFLDEQYWIDYIRGYFDGDGTIYETVYGGAFEIVGVSQPVIKWIREVLANKYGIINNQLAIEYREETKIYKTCYMAKNKLNKLYNTLYYNNDILFLQRKKSKFDDIISKFPRDFNSLVKE